MAPVAWERNPSAELLVIVELASREALSNGDTSSSQAGEVSTILGSGEIRRLQEAVDAAEASSKAAKASGDAAGEAASRLLLAGLAAATHNASEAQEHATAAQGLFKQAGDQLGTAKANHFIGWALATKGKFEEGIELCGEAGSVARRLGAKKIEALICYCISRLYLTRSLGREAVEFAEDAVAALRTLPGLTGLQASAADLLVQAYIHKGDTRSGLRVAKEGLDAFRAKHCRKEQVLMLAASAAVYSAREDGEEAEKVLEEAKALCSELGDRRLDGMVAKEFAFALLQRGLVKEAQDACGQASLAYQVAQDRLGEASVQSCLVQVKIKKEDFSGAAQAANEQKAVYQQLGDRHKEASCLLVAAGCLSNDNNLDSAMAMADEALEISVESEDPVGEAQAMMALAEIYSQREDLEMAVNKAKEMRQKAKDIGHRLLEAQACKALANAYQNAEPPRYVEAVRAANEAVLLGKKATYKPLIVEMMLLAVKVNTALVMQDGAQVSLRGAEKAVRPAREAVTVAKATMKKTLISTCLYQLAEVQLMSYQLGPAMTSAKEALEMFRERGDKAGEAGAVILMAETHYAGGRHDKAEETVKEGIELAAACGDQRKEAYGKALQAQIAQSKEAQAAAKAPKMVPMQGMMPQQALPGAAAGDAAPQAAVSVETKQVGLDAAMVQSTVQEMARQAIGVDDELFLDSALMDSGMDSLTAVSFRNGLQQQLGVKLPSSLMFDYPTMKEVSNRIVELSIENA